MREKKTFGLIFAGFAILLAILPLILTFNDILTRFFEGIYLYKFLQDKLVPLQTAIIGVLVKPLGLNFIAYKDGVLVNGLPLKFSWNCLGWQSLLLYLITSSFALTGYSYTNFSKIKTFIFGLVGIFWVNILRIYFVVLLAVYAKPLYRFVFHDYLAAILTVVFLFFFWWFAYSYIFDKNT